MRVRSEKSGSATSAPPSVPPSATLSPGLEGLEGC